MQQNLDDITLEDLIPNVEVQPGKPIVLPDAPIKKTKSGIWLNEVEDSIKNLSGAGFWGTIVQVPKLDDPKDNKFNVGDRIYFTLFNGVMFPREVEFKGIKASVRYLVTYPDDIIFRDLNAEAANLTDLFHKAPAAR